MVGRNVRLRRGDESQEGLVRRLSQHGLDWSVPKLAALERGEREHVMIEEVVLLAATLGLPLAELLATEEGEVIRLSPTATGTATATVSTIVDGKRAEGLHTPLSLAAPGTEPLTVPMKAVRQLARELGREPAEVERAARAVWDERTFWQEREQRLQMATTPIDTARTLSAKRGRITRTMSADLRAYLEAGKGKR